MTEVICIVGLPGSGKSYLGQQMVLDLGSNTALVDDIQSIDQLPKPGAYDSLVVVDPNFCSTHVRERAGKTLSEVYGPVRWIFFANDPSRCQRLVEYRDDGRQVNEFVTQLSQIYQIPEGADVRPIWQPRDSV